MNNDLLFIIEYPCDSNFTLVSFYLWLFLNYNYYDRLLWTDQLINEHIFYLFNTSICGTPHCRLLPFTYRLLSVTHWPFPLCPMTTFGHTLTTSGQPLPVIQWLLMVIPWPFPVPQWPLLVTCWQLLVAHWPPQVIHWSFLVTHFRNKILYPLPCEPIFFSDFITNWPVTEKLTSGIIDKWNLTLKNTFFKPL